MPAGLSALTVSYAKPDPTRQYPFMPNRVRHLTALGLFALVVPRTALCQESGLDTTRVYELESITKTAERSPTIVARTASAISVLPSEAVSRLPARSVTGWLATLPGMSFVNLDGLGYDAQPVVRGFYGGGEAEYVQLLVDGAPIGDAESGLINWHLLPLRSVGSLEVLRGGSSSLFGDAALGAVVNLSTERDGRGGALSAAIGSSVPFEAEIDYQTRVGDRSVRLIGDYTSVDGFRDHAEREMGSLGGSMKVLSTAATRISVSTLHAFQEASIPGPLFRAEAESDPTRSLPFFRFDRRDESTHLLGLAGHHRLPSTAEISFRINGKARFADIVETIPLAAQFADTQKRDLADVNVAANVQVATSLGAFPGRLIAGLDASGSWIDTDYANLLSGTLDDYENAARPEQAAASAGDGGRRTAALYAHYAAEPADRLRITLGGRLDALHDSFSPDGESSASSTHTAFSPKIGLNYRFVSTRSAVGNVYANVSRSFKAPTLDQLFDQRALPVPFPPFQISLSSDQLDPQTGTGVEVGMYQRLESRSSVLAAELTLAAYQIDMKDEIDFDLQQLTYLNRGESRHRGIESGLSVFYRNLLSARLAYTYQGTTIVSGDFAGNFVKAIPRDVFSAVTSLHVAPFSVTLSVQSTGRIFLDDANTIPLPGYTDASTRFAYDFGRFGLTLDIFNVLDRRFSTTGFPDPAGSTAVFFYPHADRQVRLTVDVWLP